LAELLLLNTKATGDEVLKEILHTKGMIDTLQGLCDPEAIIDLITNADLMESEDD